MDNNNSRTPRKRVSKDTLRKRQLTALGVIALIVLIFIILIAKACSNNSVKKGGDAQPNQSSTTTSVTTTSSDLDPDTTTTTTASEDTTEPVNESGFVLDMLTVRVKVGESKMPRVTGYPNGTTEADERWSSGNESIATVNSWGNITGVSAGTCYITLKSAADPTQEVTIRVIVDDGTLTQTSNTEISTSNNTTTTTPQQQNAAEAPVPPVYNDSRLTYINGTLIVNKSYQLPSDYAPGLESITLSQFQLLSNAAARDNLNIYISSGYRSYSTQESIYNSYLSYDSVQKVDTYSARPGHSEHQTGLAIDVNIISDAFIGTPEAIWIANHAHEFGFIVRYPQGKESITGYKYEPWHIRYVGSELATKLYNSGLTMEEYFNIDSYYH